MTTFPKICDFFFCLLSFVIVLSYTQSDGWCQDLGVPCDVSQWSKCAFHVHVGLQTYGKAPRESSSHMGLKSPVVIVPLSVVIVQWVRTHVVIVAYHLKGSAGRRSPWFMFCPAVHSGNPCRVCTMLSWAWVIIEWKDVSKNKTKHLLWQCAYSIAQLWLRYSVNSYAVYCQYQC